MTTKKQKKSPKGKVRKEALKHGWRSGLEQKTAEHLESKGHGYKYEESKIPWVDYQVRKYTPDFELANGIIVETKGRFLASDRRKHLKIKEQYPDLDIRFVFSNSNAKLFKGSKTNYSMWCDKYKFKWANKEIPDEWLEEDEVNFRLKDIKADE